MVTGQTVLRNCNSSLLSNANITATILNEIFARFPNRFRFTSGCRTNAENIAANGASNSFHKKALAGDFVSVNGSYPKDERVIIESILSKYNYELLLHNAGSGLHYHIEPKGQINYPVINTENPIAKVEIKIGSENDNTIYYAIGGLILLALLL